MNVTEEEQAKFVFLCGGSTVRALETIHNVGVRLIIWPNSILHSV